MSNSTVPFCCAMECRYAISRFCRRGHRSSSALRLSQCACVSRRGTQRERKASQCRFRQRSRTVSPEQPDMWFLVARRYFTIIVWQWSMFSHKVHVHTSVSHPCVLRLETTKTTGKNKFERGARANSPAGPGALRANCEAAARPRARAHKANCFQTVVSINGRAADICGK